MAKFSIEKGADIEAKNNNGNTALDLTTTKEMREVLRKAGAK